MKKVAVCFLVYLGLALANSKVRYDGYKVYQIIPTTEIEARLLHNFSYSPGYDFWSTPKMANLPATLMVAPNAQIHFEKSMTDNKMNFSIMIENVQATFDEQDAIPAASPENLRGDATFARYMSHAEMNSYLQMVAASVPHIASIVELGQSYEGRRLLGLKISSGGTNKPMIFIDAGIHAREWVAPPTALYIIQQLTENSQNAALYRDVDWFIIPSVNPDGYEYSQATDRLWRKTRSLGTSCIGTDGNRNFDYYWMHDGASANECDETYAGRYAFSETETRAIRDYLLAHRGQIKLYVTFHSYGQYMLYPWGYAGLVPSNNQALATLGQAFGNAIRAHSGTTYTVGNSAILLYPAAGGSDDYAMGVAGIDLAYTVELPAGGIWGFHPVVTRILPIVQETWEGVKALQKYVQDHYA